MRVWRLAAPNRDLRRQVDMIAALKTRPGVRQTLVAGTLTRYEKGELTPPLEVIDALEHALGLAPGEISSHLPHPAGLRLTRPQLWDLLGRADAADTTPISGRDWVHLAQQLTAPTGGSLQSPDTVAAWSRVLVSEMARSIGAPYRLRMHAISLIAHDPLTSGPLADAVTDHLQACGYTVIGDALGALTDAAHPRSAAIALATYEQLSGLPLQTAAIALADEVRRNPMHPDLWQRLRATLAADLTDVSGDREQAAAIIVAGLPRGRQADLVSRLPRPAVMRLREAMTDTRRDRPHPEQARHLRRHCEILAVSLAARHGIRPVDGLGYWLSRALLDTFDLEAALVLGSSPFADGISHALERLENPATRQPGDPRYPGAPMVMNTCLRADTIDLVSGFRDGTDEDKQRLLVPLAHHRVLPADLDLHATAGQLKSVSRVLYAAGMSAHPDLRGYAATLTGHEQKAARWWATTAAPPA